MVKLVALLFKSLPKESVFEGANKATWPSIDWGSPSIQLDNSRPGNDIESDGSDMENAIQCLKDDLENKELQKPSIGCNIKWKWQKKI